LTSIEQKFCRDDGKAYGSLGAWAEKTPVILDGRPFSFHKNKLLIISRNVVVFRNRFRSGQRRVRILPLYDIESET
jgi:hypothetical protein